MPIRRATAVWEGNLPEGKGKMKTESGVLDHTYSFASRFEEGEGTNPDELIGAAHAGCFSMALANLLAEDGFSPNRIFTKAQVNLVKAGEGFKISDITLNTEADVAEIDNQKFMEYARAAKENCPVSMALKGVEIKLEAKLTS